MGLSNVLPYITGAILIIIGIYGMARSYQEWKWHDKPVKQLALTLMISFALFGIIGGISVLMLITINPNFWAVGATAITLGYLLLAYETLNMLIQLRTTQKKLRTGETKEKYGKQRAEKVKLPLPPAGMVQSRKDAVLILRAIANYAGRPILVIGREHPDEWAKKTGIEPNDYIWLTRVEHREAVSPSSLHILTGRVEAFIRSNPGAVVYIEGIEYMLFYSDFKAVAKFLFAIRDMAIMENAHIILLVDENTMSPEQTAILKKEFEEIEVEDALKKLMGPALFGTIPSEKRRGINAGAKGPEERSGASEEKAKESGSLRREEAAKEGR